MTQGTNIATVLNMKNLFLLLTKKRRRSFARRKVKKSFVTYCIILRSRSSADGKKRSSSDLLLRKNIYSTSTKNLTTDYLSDYNKRSLFLIPSK